MSSNKTKYRIESFNYAVLLFNAMFGRTAIRKKEIVYITNKFDEDECFSMYATDEDYKKARAMYPKKEIRDKK